ncbi:MAG: hypothetical protein MPN21_15710 [Thermoanaerobaculia bacterium]|nr:hypothetical protein [Thermoanaerobaculia bacterium]
MRLDDALESRCGAALDEPPLGLASAILVVAQWIEGAAGDQVEIAVAIEVLHRDAFARIEGVQSQLLRPFHQSQFCRPRADLPAGAAVEDIHQRTVDALGIREPAYRRTARQSRQQTQPANQLPIPGRFVEKARERRCGFRGLVLMIAGGQGKSAGRRNVAPQASHAALLLASPKLGQAEQQEVVERRRCRSAQALEARDGGGVVSVVKGQPSRHRGTRCGASSCCKVELPCCVIRSQAAQVVCPVHQRPGDVPALLDPTVQQLMPRRTAQARVAQLEKEGEEQSHRQYGQGESGAGRPEGGMPPWRRPPWRRPLWRR